MQNTNEELVLRYQQGDDYAATLLWEQNIGIVHKKINEFKKYEHINYDDKLSACHRAFTYSIKNFNKDKGYKFITYFTRAITTQLIREVDLNGKIRNSKKLYDATFSYHAINKGSEDNSEYAEFIKELQIKDSYFEEDNYKVGKGVKASIEYALDRVNDDYKPYIMDMFIGKYNQTEMSELCGKSVQCVNYQIRLFRRNVKTFLDFLNGKDVELLG